jgi:D-cysteine desulfhydrase family pyridoxal phosphate-dependent enzyme
MTMEKIARTPLGAWPTPIEHLARLTRELRGPQIFMKRDDLGGMAMAGNKLRKLEFLLGDAQQSGCQTIVTAGALQSNHARQTAAAAAKLGLECHLVLQDEVPDRSREYYQSANRLLDRLLGAKVEVVGRSASLSEALRARGEALQKEGRKPYVIPVGGSNGIGSLGYVATAQEIAAQERDCGGPFSHIYVVSGSGGTHAGLIAGARLAGLQAEIVGVTISRPASVQLPLVLGLARQAAALLELSSFGFEQAVHLDDTAYLPGYGLPNAAAREAISLCAQTEAVLLDPVYTGKGMAALIRRIRNRGFDARDHVLFVHTGGAPALFAYEELFVEPGARSSSYISQPAAL